MIYHQVFRLVRSMRCGIFRWELPLWTRRKKLVWANGVFRSWIAGTEEGTPLRDIIQGQKVAKLWGKAGWFDCHAGGTFFRVFHKWVPSDEPDGASFMVLYFMDRSDVEKSLKRVGRGTPCLLSDPHRQYTGSDGGDE